jgi:hypothetical protein
MLECWKIFGCSLLACLAACHSTTKPTKRSYEWRKCMKTGMMLLGGLAVSVALILLVGCVTGKYVPKQNEELYGTWIMVKGDFPKMINLPGKREQFYPGY